MTQANAYDPSTWGSEPGNGSATEQREQRSAELHAAALPPGIDDTPVLVSDADALLRERDELRTARDGAARKVEKQRTFLDAAETELGRLTFRLEAVDRELAGLADDTEDEG